AIQLGQVRIAAWLLVAHGVGIAEAEVHHRRPGDAFQGPIDRGNAVLAGAIGPGLQVRLAAAGASAAPAPVAPAPSPTPPPPRPRSPARGVPRRGSARPG